MRFHKNSETKDFKISGFEGSSRRPHLFLSASGLEHLVDFAFSMLTNTVFIKHIEIPFPDILFANEAADIFQHDIAASFPNDILRSQDTRNDL